MAIYSIKTFNKLRSDGQVCLPFIVVELSYSDNVCLPEEDFKWWKVKRQIKGKIRGELKRLAEHREFTLKV